MRAILAATALCLLPSCTALAGVSEPEATKLRTAAHFMFADLQCPRKPGAVPAKLQEEVRRVMFANPVEAERILMQTYEDLVRSAALLGLKERCDLSSTVIELVIRGD